jgi:class 3 adenylate cyclase/predicted ATPase
MGAVMDIVVWLQSLGLEEYEAAFRDNKINERVLPNLTQEDLKEIGVGPVGHRRILLDAIAVLRNDASVQTPPVAIAPARTSAATPTSAPVAEAVGERRHVTVMFCDLVGSTGISSALDAEDWRDLVSAYLDAASAAVIDMGGHVAKKLGDGLMALFGYPVAQENDAERAARAALSIQRSLSEINRKNAGAGKPALNARIGIETGPVVVDAAGEIYGDAPNTAARVQALAEPGTVVVTARVQRQVAGLFVAEERGVHDLKGVPEPVTLFRLVRASGGGRRAGQRHLTPLVGRDEEIAILMRRWERARQGDGQLVLIVGEPGLGKSRLIEEFHSRVRDTPHTWVEWSCSQLLQNTPLHPITEWGRQRFGGADVPAERQVADLENTLALIKIDPAENVSLLAPVLDIPFPKERLPDLAPEEVRRRQLAAMTNWVIAGARSQPIVLALEDVHWADPTTIDFIRGIAERGAQAPLLVLVTARPEFRPRWGMRSHHTTISLAPLDRSQVQEMVTELSARHALPKQIIDGVTERTGGVPLFIEEVTRLLLERGEQGGAQAIPPTLQQSLMARLDRLGPAREVAQIGSVIGRGFSYKLLKAVAGMDDAPLETALEKLSDADIVLVEGVLPESDYRFKHALIQDAAYENLLKIRRQALHRRIAETLRDNFADKAAAEPEVLAHHFTEAGLTDAAIEWWGKAGDQALRRSAFQEAIAQLGKAIEMADKTAEAAPRAAAAPVSVDQRLKLQTSYGQAMLWSHGFGAEETKTAFLRAQELAVGIDNADERFKIFYGLWVGNLSRGEFALGRETAEAFRREAENAARMTEAVVGRRMLGLNYLWQGDFTQSQANLVQALRIYDPQRDREAKFRFGMDSGACATAYLAHTSWQFGEIERARELIEEAVARAVESGHAPSLAQVYQFKALLGVFRGDANAALHAGETVIGLGREHGLAIAIGWGTPCLCWARAQLGERETGVTALTQAVAAYADTYKLFLPLFQGLLAELEAGAEHADGALTRIDAALAFAGQTGEHWTDALLHRIRGEILLKRDPANTAPAEEAFLTATAVAKQQQAKSFELRAAMSLARLWRDQGKVQQARELLAPVYGWFTEGFETRDLKEAKALLDDLA